MNVSGASAYKNAATQSVAKAVQTSETEKAPVQLAMLKKALDAQTSEAAQLLKAFEGKGQNLDIRV